MFDTRITPLAGQSHVIHGIEIAEAPATGLVTYRGDLSDPRLAAAVRQVTGTDLPAQGMCVVGPQGAVGWMSPDELLLMPAFDQAAAVTAALGQAMAGRHHLVLDLSDARAVIRLKGQGLRDLLAKVTPADLRPASTPVGSLRRTRLGQAAAALVFAAEDEVWVLCFRSVGQYVFDLLAQSARDGRVGHHA